MQRSSMRLILLNTTATILLAAGCAAAQNPPAGPPGPASPGAPSSAPHKAPDGTSSVDPSIDEILDALDARGKELNDFSADVSMTEADAATQMGNTRTGRIWMQKKGA